MEVNLWLVYVGIISALIFIPGPSALLCLSHGLKHGSIRTIPTVLGGAIASLLLMSISIVGLGAILAASELAFLFIKIAGAMYLIYLGLRCWNEASFQISNDAKVKKEKNHPSFSLLSKGFMVGISNPKDLLFFAALFPSFINTQLPHLEQYTILATTWFLIDFIAMFIYASLGTKISPWFSKPINLKLFNRATGGFYISTGSTLAISSAFNKNSI